VKLQGRQAIILAGGAGTRLRDRIGDLPKPMIPIAGKPLLEHQVELCRRYGFTDLVFFVHHRADLIEKHFGDGASRGVRVRYVVEREPLGTAGAVLDGFDSLAERFLVLYGDTMVNVDLERIWRAHEQASADAALLLHPNDHPLDSDLVEMDAGGRITAFHNRPHAPGIWRQNLVNAGLYVLEKQTLAPWKVGRDVLITPDSTHIEGDALRTAHPAVLDFGRDLLPAMLAQGALLLGYNSPEYIKDIGTPERYDRVCEQFANGTVARSSLATKQRAVFLDRDGTLIQDKDCLRNAEGLELLRGVAAAIHDLNHHAWRTVVVTNQPVIAKGWCTEAELQRMHNKLETLLGTEHAFLDRIYYCPHHPDAGFAGERKELKIRCECRKPGVGMIRRAVEELNIDLAQSWFVGDTTTDMQTARNAGVRCILVRTGYGGNDGKHPARPDHIAENLGEAVRLICTQI
jgi:histidinol-phosphate phosphatase family protein